jgi:hypothetical protein
MWLQAQVGEYCHVRQGRWRLQGQALHQAQHAWAQHVQR